MHSHSVLLSKSSILVGFFTVNHPFLGTSICGNPYMFYSHWILRSIFVNHHPILNGKTLERIPTGTHFLVAPQILLLYPFLSRKRFIQIFLLSLLEKYVLFR